jgi:uncharacterized protein
MAKVRKTKKKIIKKLSLTKNFWLKLLFAILTLSLINYLIILSISAVKRSEYIGIEQKTETSIITVQGEGKIYVKPDLALINFSVKNEAQKPAEALETNIQMMNSVIDLLKYQGLAEKDLKTLNFELYPRYEYRENGERMLIGYEATQALEVKIRKIDEIGKVIQTATEAGANQTGSLSLDIEDKEKYKEEARKEAILQAKTKAEELAKQLEVELAGIKSFSEDVYFPRYFSNSNLNLESSPSAKIEPGENEIEVNVNIVYKINN